ncbi:methyltransferase [Streptomyces roseirectus]|uniref:Methyltransferase n=1 Tax=Streptomyces roseirectus TaxID=2768066 RepID=A0A7H0IPW6_9ACTN|nr:methyltransferase [Streptomyces roseirectus]QNP74832.1 methyltransferase [Streptomyces roseirectus]
MHLLLGMVWGNTISAAVTATAKLKIADHITDVPRPCEEIAEAAGTDPAATRRLLRALVSLSLLTENKQDCFALTEAGALLRDDAPDSYGQAAAVFGDEGLWQGSRGMTHSVRTGAPAFDAFMGTGLFGYLERHPEDHARFNAAMGQASRTLVPALLAHVDFGSATEVVDVGGGDGTLVAAVLGRHPHLRGTVFDTAQGATEAERTLRAAGVADRASVRHGDFFEEVPATGDLYLLKNILHDWDDAHCARIVARCRAAMRPGNRLMIIAPVLPDRATAGAATASYLNDLTMLVNLGGRERTRAEYRSLLSDGGFTVTGFQELPGAAGFFAVHATAV